MKTKQISVSEAYYKIVRKHGQEIASNFLRRMEAWDGSKSVWHAYYDKDIIKDRLQEAINE